MAMSPSNKATLKVANDRFDELPEGTERFTDYHWGIPTKHGRIDFYPSKMKWSDPSDGKIWPLIGYCWSYPTESDNFFYGEFDHLLAHIAIIENWT